MPRLFAPARQGRPPRLGTLLAEASYSDMPRPRQRECAAEHATR